MTMYHSKDVVFQLNDGSSLRDMTPYVSAVRGLPGSADLNDKTVLGDSGHKFVKGLENITFSVDFFWSDAASVGPHTVLALVRALTAATAFDHGPEGKATGDIKYSGNCWIAPNGWGVESRVGELVTMTVTFQVDGTVTLGTYA